MDHAPRLYSAIIGAPFAIVVLLLPLLSVAASSGPGCTAPTPQEQAEMKARGLPISGLLCPSDRKILGVGESFDQWYAQLRTQSPCNKNTCTLSCRTRNTGAQVCDATATKWNSIGCHPNNNTAIFPSVSYGFAAHIDLLRNYCGKQGRCTITSIIDKWAKTSDERQFAYSAFVSRNAGVPVNQVFDPNNIDVVGRIALAMSCFEAGSMPYDVNELKQGLAMAGGGPRVPTPANVGQLLNESQTGGYAPNASYSPDDLRQFQSQYKQYLLQQQQELEALQGRAAIQAEDQQQLEQQRQQIQQQLKQVQQQQQDELARQTQQAQQQLDQQMKDLQDKQRQLNEQKQLSDQERARQQQLLDQQRQQMQQEQRNLQQRQQQLNQQQPFQPQMPMPQQPQMPTQQQPTPQQQTDQQTPATAGPNTITDALKDLLSPPGTAGVRPTQSPFQNFFTPDRSNTPAPAANPVDTRGLGNTRVETPPSSPDGIRTIITTDTPASEGGSLANQPGVRTQNTFTAGQGGQYSTDSPVVFTALSQALQTLQSMFSRITALF